MKKKKIIIIYLSKTFLQFFKKSTVLNIFCFNFIDEKILEFVDFSGFTKGNFSKHYITQQAKYVTYKYKTNIL